MCNVVSSATTYIYENINCTIFCCDTYVDLWRISYTNNGNEGASYVEGKKVEKCVTHLMPWTN